MVLDLDGLKITEVSAKPQDTEVGVRAENAADTMPDPAADPNLLKLKNDPKFWDFVLGLPPKATKP